MTEKINLNVKHPLQNTWIMWYDHNDKRNNSAQAWSDNLKQVNAIDTVEDFWGTLNNVSKAKHLAPNTNYHFFKNGIRPEWEDPSNAKGGKFVITIPRVKTSDVIDEYWTNLLMAIIGEQFATDEEVCGAVMSSRKALYRMALWIKTSDDEEKVKKISEHLSQVLSLPEAIEIEFTAHDDSPAKLAAEHAAAVAEERRLAYEERKAAAAAAAGEAEEAPKEEDSEVKATA